MDVRLDGTCFSIIFNRPFLKNSQLSFVDRVFDSLVISSDSLSALLFMASKFPSLYLWIFLFGVLSYMGHSCWSTVTMSWSPIPGITSEYLTKDGLLMKYRSSML